MLPELDLFAVSQEVPCCLRKGSLEEWVRTIEFVDLAFGATNLR